MSPSRLFCDKFFPKKRFVLQTNLTSTLSQIHSQITPENLTLLKQKEVSQF